MGRPLSQQDLTQRDERYVVVKLLYPCELGEAGANFYGIVHKGAGGFGEVVLNNGYFFDVFDYGVSWIAYALDFDVEYTDKGVVYHPLNRKQRRSRVGRK